MNDELILFRAIQHAEELLATGELTQDACIAAAAAYGVDPGTVYALTVEKLQACSAARLTLEELR